MRAGSIRECCWMWSISFGGACHRVGGWVKAPVEFLQFNEKGDPWCLQPWRRICERATKQALKT